MGVGVDHMVKLINKVMWYLNFSLEFFIKEKQRDKNKCIMK